jgi:hypothetical protein
MAWFEDYDRGYREGWNRGSGRQQWGYGGGWTDRNERWDRPARDRGGFRGYSYDYEYRRPPEQSPAYGRQGDREVRRWANRYGYDEGFEINPNQSGGRPARYGQGAGSQTGNWQSDRGIGSQPRQGGDWQSDRGIGSPAWRQGPRPGRRLAE